MRRKPTLPPFLRIIRERFPSEYRQQIREPDNVVSLLTPLAEALETEVCWAVLLDSQSKVRGIVEVSRGILNSSLLHPREVFRIAIAYGAAGIILAHNHPSGDPTPSAEDRTVTRQMVEAGRLLDIPMYDHIILGNARYSSMATLGLI